MVWGKDLKLIWKYFTAVRTNGKKYVICNFCETSYLSHTGKMRRHLLKCVKCPQNIKDEVILKKPPDHSILVKYADNESTNGEIDYKYFITETDPNAPLESISGAYLSDDEETTEDNLEIFGRYVASEIRNLKSKQLQRRLKRKILNLILDVYSEDEVINVDVE